MPTNPRQIDAATKDFCLFVKLESSLLWERVAVDELEVESMDQLGVEFEPRSS